MIVFIMPLNVFVSKWIVDFHPLCPIRRVRSDGGFNSGCSIRIQASLELARSLVTKISTNLMTCQDHDLSHRSMRACYFGNQRRPNDSVPSRHQMAWNWFDAWRKDWRSVYIKHAWFVLCSQGRTKKTHTKLFYTRKYVIEQYTMSLIPPVHFICWLIRSQTGLFLPLKPRCLSLITSLVLAW